PGVWGSEMTCNAGCSDGACNDPDGAGDTCSDTIDATPLVSSPGTTTLTGNLGDYTHHIEEGSSPCPNENLITVADLSGPDVIYTLDMEDGDEVTATMEIDGDVDPAVIIQPGCTNLNDTCYEAYADYLGDGSAEASHTASQDETVYIVADSDSNVADDDYTLELDIE
ncbi:MAG: hypothetical protein ACOCV2_10840, partial [Persicimonas sp.]